MYYEADMSEIKIQILRIVDTRQPGFVECQFSDAWGVVHVVIEKIPVVSREHLWMDNKFPACGAIRCEIVKEWIEDERKLINVSTEKPDGVETTNGIHEFDMLPHQMLNLSD